MTLFEIFGWIGAILVLVAYFMVSTKRAQGDSVLFQLINIIGAALLIIYTYNCKAYASMLVNIIWVAIGASSFVRLLKLSSLNLEGIYTMKTKMKALLTFTLLALIALVNPASANSNSDLYAQSSEGNETSIFDEEIATESSEVETEEKPADADESLEESTDEEF